MARSRAGLTGADNENRIIGNVYDDTGLARDAGKGEDGYHDPLGCGSPWPQWCVLAVNGHGDALLVPVVMEPLRESFDRKAATVCYRVSVFVPNLGTAVTCLVGQEAHRPVSVITASGKRWHVLTGCGHWHPSREVPETVMDRLLPNHVQVAYRAAKAAAGPPQDE